MLLVSAARELLQLSVTDTKTNVSPVNKAALSFQTGLVHERYTLFKVLSPVEHKTNVVIIAPGHSKPLWEQQEPMLTAPN